MGVVPRFEAMKLRERFSKDDLVGVHFALNVFISTTLLWIILHLYARLNPIWAISSMIAASDPDVKQAVKTFRGRITNAAVGCAVGLLFLVMGGSSSWKLPIALDLFGANAGIMVAAGADHRRDHHRGRSPKRLEVD